MLYIVAYLDLNGKSRGEEKGGFSDSWLDVRKREGGGVIQMRTLCNRGGGGV